MCNSGCAARLLFLRRRYLGGTNENNICMRPPTLVHQYARGCTATEQPLSRCSVSRCLQRDGPNFITSSKFLLRSKSYLAKRSCIAFLRRFPEFRIYLRKQNSILCAKEPCNKAKHCSKSLPRRVVIIFKFYLLGNDHFT